MAKNLLREYRRIPHHLCPTRKFLKFPFVFQIFYAIIDWPFVYGLFCYGKMPVGPQSPPSSVSGEGRKEDLQ